MIGNCDHCRNSGELGAGPHGLKWCGACRALVEGFHDTQRVAIQLERDHDALPVPPQAVAQLVGHYRERAAQLKASLDQRYHDARQGERAQNPPGQGPAPAPEITHSAPDVRPGAPAKPKRSVADTVIRTVLFLGVAGLVVTLFTLIYSRHGALGGGAKLGLIAAATAAVFGIGLGLRGRLDYGRTGAAMILLGGVFLPLNWYAARTFGLLGTSGGSLVEWGAVLSVCSLAYIALARRVTDVGLEFLVVLGIGCALGCFAAAWIPMPAGRGGGAAVVAAAALWFLPALGPAYRRPILVGSVLYGIGAVLSYVAQLPALEAGVRLWPLAVHGFALTLLAQSVDLRGGRGARYIVPALLAANLLILARGFSTGQHHGGGVLFIIAALLLGQAALWARASASWLQSVLPDASETEARAFAEGSAAASHRVATGLALLATLWTLLVISLHVLGSRPQVVLLAGSTLSIWASVFIGALFSALASLRTPRWAAGVVVFLCSGAAFGAAGGPVSVSLAVALTGVVLAAATGWWENERAQPAFACATFAMLSAATLDALRNAPPSAFDVLFRSPSGGSHVNWSAIATAAIAVAVDRIRPPAARELPQGLMPRIAQLMVLLAAAGGLMAVAPVLVAPVSAAALLLVAELVVRSEPSSEALEAADAASGPTVEPAQEPWRRRSGELFALGILATALSIFEVKTAFGTHLAHVGAATLTAAGFGVLLVRGAAVWFGSGFGVAVLVLTSLVAQWAAPAGATSGAAGLGLALGAIVLQQLGRFGVPGTVSRVGVLAVGLLVAAGGAGLVLGAVTPGGWAMTAAAMACSVALLLEAQRQLSAEDAAEQAAGGVLGGIAVTVGTAAGLLLAFQLDLIRWTPHGWTRAAAAQALGLQVVAILLGILSGRRPAGEADAPTPPGGWVSALFAGALGATVLTAGFDLLNGPHFADWIFVTAALVFASITALLHLPAAATSTSTLASLAALVTLAWTRGAPQSPGWVLGLCGFYVAAGWAGVGLNRPGVARTQHILAALAWWWALLRWDVESLGLIAALPAVLLLLHGVRPSVLASGERGLITAGLALGLIPTMLEAVRSESATPSIALLVVAVALVGLGIQLKIRRLFFRAALGLMAALVVQIVRLIDFGWLPTWAWIGGASVVLVLVGFAGERTIKRALRGGVDRAGRRLDERLEGWR